jgi:TetR/AcrR family transcriptional regulator, transcriptional repressor for nem operon
VPARKHTGEIPDQALERALRLFWQRGYYDTSIGTLISDAKIHRATIYRHFGSKQAFFQKLLEYYRDTVAARMLAPLRTEGADIEAVRRFFLGLRVLAGSEHSRRGCMMVVAGSEVSTRDRAIGRIVTRFMDEVRGLFRAAIDRSRAAGALHERADPERLADYFLGALVGFMTLARSPLPRTALVHHVDEVLAHVEGLHRRTGDAAHDARA